jgi:hypothetical protein
MNQQISRIVDSRTLFLIGISAGFVAAVFPRLLPLLSEVASEVSFGYFTTKYFIVVAVFSFMIGVAMVWIYKGTKEHTKNLFISALALPAVLSGGMNMSSVSSISEQQLNALDMQTRQLHEELQKSSGIDSFELDIGGAESLPVSFLQNILGVSDVYAADGALQQKEESGASITIQSQTLNKDFVLMYGASDNKEGIMTQLKELQTQEITDVAPYKIKDKYYLLQNKRKTKTEALIEAIDVKKKTNIKPRIVKLK